MEFYVTAGGLIKHWKHVLLIIIIIKEKRPIKVLLIPKLNLSREGCVSRDSLNYVNLPTGTECIKRINFPTYCRLILLSS